jgi:hypothetical protein
MSNDTELVVLFAMLHLIALAAGGGLLLLAFSGADGYGDAHPDRGSGGDQPPDPPGRPIGGPPLPVAVPARVRLRAPARLADLVPPAPRRAAREPNRPAPRPASTPPTDHPTRESPACSAICSWPLTAHHMPNGRLPTPGASRRPPRAG